MYHTPPKPELFPQAFFTADDLPALRDKLAHPDCAAAWARLLEACEQMLSAEPPAVCLRHIRAEHMAFAWLMTGDDRFAEKSRSMALAVAAREVFVQPTAHGRAGLATGGAVRQIALTYDWLYDFLSEDDRHTLREAVRVKAFDPVLADFAEHKPYAEWYTCNGINVLNAPLLLSAMLFADAMDTRAIYELTLHQTRMAIASHCPDGAYPEGPGYWNYGIRFMLLGVEPLRRMRGIDLYREPFLRNTGDYLLHYLDPGMLRCTNPADSLTHTKLWPAIAAFAAIHREPKWQWIARRLLKHDWQRDGEGLEYSLMYLVYYEPDLPDAPPGDEQAAQLFSGLQNLSMRSGWQDDAIHLLWLNGPSNCHHNHLHLNSFTLTAHGERMLIDMGKHDYANYDDYRRHTEGHNSLLVDGKGQIITTDDAVFCRRIRAGQWGTVYGVFDNLREEAGATLATGRTVNAYPDRLRSFDRTLAFVNRQWFVMHDFVETLGQPGIDLTWLFHTGGEVALHTHDDGTIEATLRVGQTGLQMLFVADVQLHARVVHDYIEIENEGDPHASLRLDATCNADQRTANVFGLLVPFRGNTPAAQLRRTEHGVDVVVDAVTRSYQARTRKLFDGPVVEPVMV